MQNFNLNSDPVFIENGGYRGNFVSATDKEKKLENNTSKEIATRPHSTKDDSLDTGLSAYLSNSSSQVSPMGSEQSDCSPRLKNKRGKVYKRSLETRLKISIANKGKKPVNGIKKGQVGKDHPSYRHGMGKQRDSNPEKREAWIKGVKEKSNFRCFITGETRKNYLACHHLNAWNWCIEGRYDINNGVCISKEIHQDFHRIFGAGEVTTADFERYLVQYHQWNPENFPWKTENHEPSLSVEEIITHSRSSREKKTEQLKELAYSLNHFVLTGKYENIHSRLTIKCNEHNEIFETTVHNYKRCKNGLPCCGHEKQKTKALNYKRDNTGRYKK